MSVGKKGSMNGKAGSIDTAPCKGTRDFPPDDMRMRTWLFDNFRKVRCQRILWSAFTTDSRANPFSWSIQVSRLFAFEEVDFPMVESEELYTRKAGEEIVEQVITPQPWLNINCRLLHTVLVLSPRLTSMSTAGYLIGLGKFRWCSSTILRIKAEGRWRCDPSSRLLWLALFCRKGPYFFIQCSVLLLWIWSFGLSLKSFMLFLGRKSQAFPLKWFAIGQCWRYENTTRGRRREHYQWNMDIIGVPGVEVSSLDFIYFFNYFVQCYW